MILLIQDLINFGKWLNENNLESFGKNVKDDDYILSINFEEDKFSIGDIIKKENYNSSFYEKSIFHDELFIETDQKIIIPSKSFLLGLTPFFIKLDNKFTKRNELDYDKCDKFKNKIERSINANKKKKGFIYPLVELNKNSFENFFEICIHDDSVKEIFKKFLNCYSIEDIQKRIVDFYSFLYENYMQIILKIVEFKKEVDNSNRNFYLACPFGNLFDMINDLFYLYSKFLKTRSKEFNDDLDGKCLYCQRKIITYPLLGCFAINNHNSFEFNGSISNSKLRVCKQCNFYLHSAESKLMNMFKRNFIIVPKVKEAQSFSDFLKIVNIDNNDFYKINEFLKLNNEFFSYDLIIYTLEKGDTFHIQKYVENYRAFLTKFENIKLYDDNRLNYLFFEHSNSNDEFINNVFDLEKIFKEFFINVDNIIKLPNIRYFYQIFLKKPNDIFKGFDSDTISIFTIYMHNIFNFIYELNFDAIDKNSFNVIVSNCLIKLEKNPIKNLKFEILKRLNYYFMFINEFLGETMLNDKSVMSLKDIFKTKNKDKFYNNKDEIIRIIENDVGVKYYLIGQFIAHIDNIKKSNNKNADVFSNYVLNLNKNNILKLFTTEILQKNNYYINESNFKLKFLFEILEIEMDTLFNEENLMFEDYLILMFTGYYTENIISSSYNDGDDEND